LGQLSAKIREERLPQDLGRRFSANPFNAATRFFGPVVGDAFDGEHVDPHFQEPFRVADPEPDGKRLLVDAAERLKLSARGYHRVLRVARTLADLDGSAGVRRPHVAEALAYRRTGFARG
jgi:magnesium chelatase family protein